MLNLFYISYYFTEILHVINRTLLTELLGHSIDSVCNLSFYVLTQESKNFLINKAKKNLKNGEYS